MAHDDSFRHGLVQRQERGQRVGALCTEYSEFQQGGNVSLAVSAMEASAMLNTISTGVCLNRSMSPGPRLT